MKIIGHQKITNFLSRSLEKNAIAQAYLFSGPEHVGKFTVALDFAKKITGEPAAKINPDLIIIEPEREEKNGKIKLKDIKIEAIRELERNLSLSSYFGHHRAAIINDADYLTISAQNALLKTLEEPPKGCVIILICHDQGKIMPTVRSRCFIKKFSLVKKKEIAELVSSAEENREIADWSLGRPGLAIELSSNAERLAERKAVFSDLEKIISGNLNDRFVLAEALSKNPAEAANRIELWMAILRKNILHRNIFPAITKEKSLILMERMKEGIDLMKETNSNPRTVLENLFLNF
jgi:DNA polymerase III subunit delta'